jgi:hypothetical protein
MCVGDLIHLHVLQVLLAPGWRGCAKIPARDLAALVVLEERRVPEALLDAGSAGREGRAYVMLVCLFVFI